MTEADDQGKLLRWCASRGLFARKLTCAGHRGWPDIFVGSPFTHQTLFIEMKAPNGVMSAHQKMTGNMLRKCGLNHVVCWSVEEAKLIIKSYCLAKDTA